MMFNVILSSNDEHFKYPVMFRYQNGKPEFKCTYHADTCIYVMHRTTGSYAIIRLYILYIYI